MIMSTRLRRVGSGRIGLFQNVGRADFLRVWIGSYKFDARDTSMQLYLIMHTVLDLYMHEYSLLRTGVRTQTDPYPAHSGAACDRLLGDGSSASTLTSYTAGACPRGSVLKRRRIARSS